ncbi:ParB/RepB/Spo0J family partition protein [Desulfallas thermosapovorans]|uniref:ParB family chromosome partitioning protein n=1 Tax=Desulfallas thermosapovorans DSM 6562 TaxID=1121431 RepID=A0A5S4ZW33_9FIRM|nr:ParB/RepB/Spo0J family partition protein [Desulfallas thermosapovorans]TYO96426.1 ParB family chromosome partitioning protein [Desulfallas thermosapovorans DSM 6562]
MSKKRGLGKGLSVLIPVKEETNDNGISENEMKEVDINKIYPNPNQPRQKIDEHSLNELVYSIETHGLIQPIVVRPAKDDCYEIIAGERRWLACKKLNLDKVPVVVKNYSDLEASAAALIENIQREDLNTIEEASAYRKLMDKYGLTQEELSAQVGKSRSFIANMVRILALPDAIKDMLMEGVITAGHARALLSLPDHETQIKLALKVIKQQLSVRKTEEMVKKYIEIKQDTKKNKTDPVILEWQKKLLQGIDKKVKIKSNPNGSGKIIIEYKDNDELVSLINKIKIS